MMPIEMLKSLKKVEGTKTTKLSTPRESKVMVTFTVLSGDTTLARFTTGAGSEIEK